MSEHAGKQEDTHRQKGGAFFSGGLLAREEAGTEKISKLKEGTALRNIVFSRLLLQEKRDGIEIGSLLKPYVTKNLRVVALQ